MVGEQAGSRPDLLQLPPMANLRYWARSSTGWGGPVPAERLGGGRRRALVDGFEDVMAKATGMRLVGWRSLRQGKLYGFAEVELPIGLRLAEIPVLRGSEGPWAALPGKPELERDGRTVRRDADGKVVYRDLLAWRSRKLREAFSERVAARSSALPRPRSSRSSAISMTLMSAAPTRSTPGRLLPRCCRRSIAMACARSWSRAPRASAAI